MYPAKFTVAIAGLGCLLLAGSHTFSQMTPATNPASMPTTEPVKADATTPKGTLLLLSQATAAGDTQTVLGLLEVSNPQDKKLADALMRRNIVNVKFRTALAKSFGEEVATQMAGSASDDESRIAAASVEMLGDVATVHMGDNGEPVSLARSADGWKLSLKGLTGGMKPEQVDDQLSKMKVVVDAIDAATEDIAAGKFKTPDDVATALRNRLMASATPSTMPSTLP